MFSEEELGAAWPEFREWGERGVIVATLRKVSTVSPALKGINYQPWGSDYVRPRSHPPRAEGRPRTGRRCPPRSSTIGDQITPNKQMHQWVRDPAVCSRLCEKTLPFSLKK